MSRSVKTQVAIAANKGVVKIPLAGKLAGFTGQHDPSSSTFTKESYQYFGGLAFTLY